MIKNMPKLSPVHIEIEHLSSDERYKHWRTYKREWELLEDWTYPINGGKETVVIPKSFRFDGVSMPKWLHWFHSPTGLLFIPSLIHDFAYRYDYVWIEKSDGSVEKYGENRGRDFWDDMFKEVSLELNKMCGLNAFSRGILYFFSGVSWKRNRARTVPEIKPERALV